MPRHAFLAGLMLIVLLCALPVGSTVPGCPVAPEMVTAEVLPGTMPRVAAALKSGRLDVLAIGSGTSLGTRGRPEGSFSDRMVQELRAASPGADIHLTVQGERGMTATAMLAALRKGLDHKAIDLVVWQTGTVEAVRRLAPDEFARTLDAGAEATQAAGADLLLVDPQYSRMLQTHATLAPYRETMQQVARRHAAVLFRRFDLIRQWVEAGQIDLESVAKRDRVRMTERLNACLGEALAQTVLRAAGLARS
jgi:cellobiose-specific phosphotransferase system component IIB